MRRTVLALAAIVAATGLAMGKEAQTTKPHAPAACGITKSGERLDCADTGAPAPTKSTKPRLGIDIDPWWVPPFN
ncbi:MAG: hypothetical protein ABS58_05495 [Mesorhizobium sp. SCN 65-20]|nr:MAG: hypothetical protein ABS58_05495 [Mesorhizobium sp. SCN 65-20]